MLSIGRSPFFFLLAPVAPVAPARSSEPAESSRSLPLSDTFGRGSGVAAVDDVSEWPRLRFRTATGLVADAGRSTCGGRRDVLR